jgi:hypothetical protein
MTCNYFTFNIMQARTIQLALAISAVAAILFVASSGMAVAKNITSDPAGDTATHPHFTDDDLANLDIHKYGFAGARAYLQVWGTAGGTLPEHDEEEEGFGHAIAYVINVVTSSGEHQTWAIDSHEAQHGSVGVGEAWHGHRVVVEGNCLNEVDQVTSATVKNKHVWFDNMVVRGKSGNLETVDVVEITSAATVLLQVMVADPDNPPEGTPCIALVDHVFDTA